jgi:alkanesulfonate monooxygenase SsuD/methylene tetrahydromethanopterin reductase-like flavin-dependent oxidoreductase (luciferase family)
MRYGVYAPNVGTCGDPNVLVSLARESEAAGWDGFFLWDTLLDAPGVAVADSWVTLAAIAATTQRILIGPLVAPLPRHRPWLIARESVTIDRLSAGRFILGVGAGGDWNRELSAFGEEMDRFVRAEMLDEGLSLIASLWSGAEVEHLGRHYVTRSVRFLPQPVQRPRIPVWVGAVWPNPRPIERAARWDGIFPILSGGPVTPIKPDDVRAVVATVAEERRKMGRTLEGFEVAVQGRTTSLPPEEALRRCDEFADAGATWWLETIQPDEPVESIRRWISRGPCRPRPIGH